MTATNKTLIVHDNNTKFLAFKKSITPNKISVYIYIYIYIVSKPDTMEPVW